MSGSIPESIVEDMMREFEKVRKNCYDTTLQCNRCSEMT